MSENIQVPKGWEVIEFCNIVNLRNKKYIPNQNDNIKCIELECIEKENGNLLYYINSNTQKSTKNYFYKNDVLYGKLRPYLKKYFYATFDGVCSTEIWVFNATNKIDSYYLFLIIQSNKFNQYTNISTGTRMPRADWNIVSNMPILLPPLEEQKKIAEILSLWDKAIEQTKELIAYKEKQKKGLMQALLTGKKRLNGFTDEWKTTKLGEVAETYGGLTNKTKKDFGNRGSKYISYLEIYQNYYLKKPTNNYVLVKDNETQTELEYGDILFTLSSETPEEVGISCAILFEPKEKILLNSFSFCLRLKENNILYPLFSAYIFRAKHIRKLVNKLAQGATRYNLSKASFLKLNITIPTSLDEQKAIADILLKVDEEIELLNKQLYLYTEQKKGLMQNLLTGKVRV